MAIDPLSLDFGRDKRFCVYLYRDPRPGKRKQPIYVGKGSRNEGRHRRPDYHWLHGNRGTNALFRNVLDLIRAAGLSPVIEIIAWFDEEEGAFALERTLISRFGRRDRGLGPLLNFTDGGDGAVGMHHTEQARAKIGAASLGNRYNLGRKLSPEHRMKIGAASRGNKHRLGKKHSPETKAKIGLTSKGNQNCLGRKHSAETRAKMSISQKLRAPESQKRGGETRRGQKRGRYKKRS